MARTRFKFVSLYLLTFMIGAAPAWATSTLRFPEDCPNYPHRGEQSSAIANVCGHVPALSDDPTVVATAKSDNLKGWVSLASHDSNPLGFLISCRYVRGPAVPNATDADDADSIEAMLRLDNVGATQWDDADPKNASIDAWHYRSLAERLSPLSYALADPNSHYLQYVLGKIRAAGGDTTIPEARQYLKDLTYLQMAMDRLDDRCKREPGSNFEPGFPDFCRWYNGKTSVVNDADGTSHTITQASTDSNINRFVLSAMMSIAHRLSSNDYAAALANTRPGGWKEAQDIIAAIRRKNIGTAQNPGVLHLAARAQVGAYKYPLWKGGDEHCPAHGDQNSSPLSLCFDNNMASQYANMDLEYVVIMDYAHKLFGDTDPSTAAGFAGESAEMMKYVSRELISSPTTHAGGLHYIATGTESPIYHTLDLVLLHEHFNLIDQQPNPGDPASLQNLISAGYQYFVNTYTSAGVPEGWSDNYWKQQWYHPGTAGLLALLGAPPFSHDANGQIVESVWRAQTERLLWTILSATKRPCDGDNPNWMAGFPGHYDVLTLDDWRHYAQSRAWIGNPQQTPPAQPGQALESSVLRWNPDVQGFHGRANIAEASATAPASDWDFGFVTGPGGFHTTIVGGAITSSGSNLQKPGGFVFANAAAPANATGAQIDPATGILRGVELEVMTEHTDPTSASYGLRHGDWLAPMLHPLIAWRHAKDTAGQDRTESAMADVQYVLQPTGAKQLLSTSQETPFTVRQLWRVSGSGMIGLVRLEARAPAEKLKAVVGRIIMGPNDVVPVNGDTFRSGPLAVRFYALTGFTAEDISVAHMPENVELSNHNEQLSKMGIQILHPLSDGKMAANAVYQFAVWIGPMNRLASAPTTISPLYWDEDHQLAGWQATVPSMQQQAGTTIVATGNQENAARSVMLSSPAAHSYCMQELLDVSVREDRCMTTPISGNATKRLTLAPHVAALVEP